MYYVRDLFPVMVRRSGANISSSVVVNHTKNFNICVSMSIFLYVCLSLTTLQPRMLRKQLFLA